MLFVDRPYGELFDRQEDPGQLHNRWADPGLAGVKAELTMELLHRLALTDSRLPRRLCHA